MPAPTFAIMRRGKQLVDELFVRIWSLILDEGIDFFGRGRQADEIVIHTADKGYSIRMGSRG